MATWSAFVIERSSWEHKTEPPCQQLSALFVVVIQSRASLLPANSAAITDRGLYRFLHGRAATSVAACAE